MRNSLRRNRRRDTASCGILAPGNLGIKCERLRHHEDKHYAEPGVSWENFGHDPYSRYFAGYRDAASRMSKRSDNGW